MAPLQEKDFAVLVGKLIGDEERALTSEEGERRYTLLTAEQAAQAKEATERATGEPLAQAAAKQVANADAWRLPPDALARLAQDLGQVRMLNRLLSLLRAAVAPEVDAYLREAEALITEAGGPGSFSGDVLTVLLRHPAQMEALDRLMSAPFAKGAVFHSGRWRQLEGAFRSYRQEAGAGPDRAWLLLAGASLFLVVQDKHGDIIGAVKWHSPDAFELEAVQPLLRRHLRPEIEQTLLGHTLDTKAEVALPESLPSQAGEAPTEPAADWLQELAASAGVHPDDLAALLEHQAGRTIEYLASEAGISPDAMDKRLDRALAKLKKAGRDQNILHR